MKTRNYFADLNALPDSDKTLARGVHTLGQAIEAIIGHREQAKEAARQHGHRIGLTGDGDYVVFADSARSRTWQDKDPIMRLAEHIASTLDDENKVPETKSVEQIAASRRHLYNL